MVTKYIAKQDSGYTADYYCDNGTTNQIVIQQAINSLVQGDTLFFYLGTYICDTPIKEWSGIHLTSDINNRATIKVKEYVENPGSAYCGTIWKAFGRGLLKISNATISNLIFDGSLGKQYLVAGQGCGNLMDIGGSVTIDNCIFKDGINDAIMVQGSNNIVRNCKFLNIIHDCVAIGKWSTLPGTTNDLFENNYANNWEVDWFRPGLPTLKIGWHNSMFRVYNATGTVFDGNVSESPNAQLPFGLTPETGNWNCSDIIFKNNIIKNCIDNAGIYFSDLSGVTPPQQKRTNIKILNNTFINNKGWEPGGAIAFLGIGYYGISTPRSWNNIEIAYNNFQSSNKYDITYQPSSVITGTINVHDNYTDDNPCLIPVCDLQISQV